MKIYQLFVGIISLCALVTTSVSAQGGDQILDGIGETALIARYTFTRDANDRSRNNLHGSIQGSDVNFVDDSLFRRVLSLQGDGEAYISIPGEAVTLHHGRGPDVRRSPPHHRAGRDARRAQYALRPVDESPEFGGRLDVLAFRDRLAGLQPRPHPPQGLEKRPEFHGEVADNRKGLERRDRYRRFQIADEHLAREAYDAVN